MGKQQGTSCTCHKYSLLIMSATHIFPYWHDGRPCHPVRIHETRKPLLRAKAPVNITFDVTTQRKKNRTTQTHVHQKRSSKKQVVVKIQRTMTMTQSVKVIKHLSGTWPYGLQCWGNNPVKKKKSVELVKPYAASKENCRVEREKKNLLNLLTLCENPNKNLSSIARLKKIVSGTLTKIPLGNFGEQRKL